MNRWHRRTDGTGVYDEVANVPAHDPAVLPHEYAAEELDVYFPKAKAVKPEWTEFEPEDRDYEEPRIYQR